MMLKNILIYISDSQLKICGSIFFVVILGGANLASSPKMPPYCGKLVKLKKKSPHSEFS